MTTSSPIRALLGAAILAALGGCADMSGLGGTSAYACKAPAGVQCDSLSGVYENSVRNNLPSQRTARKAETGGPVMTGAPSPTATAARAEAQPGYALRSDARQLRMWVRAWEDQDRDLVDESYVYIAVDHGRWLLDHVQARTRDAYAPVRSVQDAAPAPAPRDPAAAQPESRPAVSPQLPPAVMEAIQAPAPARDPA